MKILVVLLFSLIFISISLVVFGLHTILKNKKKVLNLLF
ncbi:MAG: hypothetical protein PEPC_00890 [Peptostreptococcus russellii]